MTTTCIASASIEGTVRIWENGKPSPLVVFRPHGGQPFNSVTFLTSPHRPNHIVLITAGPLNREVKMWSSASGEVWLLSSDAESWQCTQALELRSSAEPRVDDAFFNQVAALPSAGLILLGNAKRNAMYAVHVDYGPCPAATRMDYIAEFTVTMPILSLTGTCNTLPDRDHAVHVYCLETQAMQQYVLELSQCSPPRTENMGLGKTDCDLTGTFEACNSDGVASLEASQGSGHRDAPATNPALPSTSPETVPGYPGSSDVPRLHELEISDEISVPAATDCSSETKSITRKSGTSLFLFWGRKMQEEEEEKDDSFAASMNKISEHGPSSAISSFRITVAVLVGFSFFSFFHDFFFFIEREIRELDDEEEQYITEKRRGKEDGMGLPESSIDCNGQQLERLTEITNAAGAVQ
ncbi:hypothetical protein C5167_035405 [Papaver somniferum]|uniref:Uncharacterized protein n=1 Tax=Papaver somniferum TaxID=3469 RepID=A0A4Y7KIP8_PAPSO|nr:hypothetical protein C5167_035405 [Papaver somniferum]